MTWSTFRALRRWIAPTWLTSGEGERIGYALDLVVDAFAERVRLGLLARFPQQDARGTAGPADALTSLGRDRRVVRGLTDSHEQFAARLVRWLDDRQHSGSAPALLERLAEYLGEPAVRLRIVDAHGTWHTREADGSTSERRAAGNWRWDWWPILPSGQHRWARFWVIVYAAPRWSIEGTWGEDSEWGELESLGTTMPAEVVDTMRALVADWKPEGTSCEGLLLAFDSDDFDPAAGAWDPGMPAEQWGTWSTNSGGTQVPVRLSTARFASGV